MMLEQQPGGFNVGPEATQSAEDIQAGSSSASHVKEGVTGNLPHPGVSWYRDRLLSSTLLAVILFDQLTKYVVKNNLALRESWPDTGFVRLTHGTNTGTAFGLLPDQTLFLIVASIFAIAFLYYFYKTHTLSSRLLRLAIGLQLGGAVGNLIDRVRLGAVVDFIDVGPWPIFNVADSSIVTGIAILIGVMLFRADTRPEPTDPDGLTVTDQ